MKEAIKKLKEIKAKRIFVQFPEGLKLRIQDIAKQLEEEGFEVILCLEPTYGACDIREHEAVSLDCDAILNIGHINFGIKTKLPVIYWEYFLDTNPIPILEKEFEKLRDFKKIGLVTSIQFVKCIPEIKEFLEKKNKTVVIHKSLQYPGQILGCNLDAVKQIEKKVDCFLCISAGKFYGLGLILNTDKVVLCLDLEKNEIYGLDDLKKRIQKIVEWNKSQLQDAKRVGLLVSWKKGQMLGNPFKAKQKLEKDGKEVFILAMDEISMDKIGGLRLDVLVNFGCPRISLDDQAKYKVPMLNWDNL